MRTSYDALVGDEVWMLYSADNLFVFWRKEQYHVLVAEVFGLDDELLPEFKDLMDEVFALVKTNDPLIQDLEIW